MTAATVLGWYRDIVAAVAALPASGAAAPLAAGAAAPGGAPERVPVASFGALASALAEAADSGRASLLAAAGHGTLTHQETVSNAAIALFGGIETVEGMICNAVTYLLAEHVTSRADTDVERCVEESLRLEPAVAVVDRYATRPGSRAEPCRRFSCACT